MGRRRAQPRPSHGPSSPRPGFAAAGPANSEEGEQFEVLPSQSKRQAGREKKDEGRVSGRGWDTLSTRVAAVRLRQANTR